MATHKGKVNNLQPGYGFIKGDDKKDYFFIPTSLAEGSTSFSSLEVGQKVEFNTKPHTRMVKRVVDDVEIDVELKSERAIDIVIVAAKTVAKK